MMEIQDWRVKIDALENDLIRLLEERAACAVEIGRIKRERGLPVFDPQRENEILDRVASKAKGHLPPDSLRRLFLTLMEETRKLEERHA